MRRSAILWALAMLVGMAFIGFGLAVGGIYFAALITAMVLAVPLLLMPLEQLLWGGWVLTFLVAGPLQYFAHISKAFWLPYLFGALLFLRLPIDVMAAQKPVGSALAADNSLKKWIFVFFAVTAFSTAVNAPPVLQVLLALKEYLFLWSFLVVLGLGLASSRYFDGTWKAMLWLVPLHIPVVLYQRFAVVPGRTDAASFDAVVGLFGGTPEAGGATGGMGLFLLFTWMLAISLWREGRLRTSAMTGIGITVLVSVLLADIKFVILLLPFALALLYRRELLRRPFRVIAIIVATLVIAGGLATAYQWQFARQGEFGGPFGYIERAIEKNSDNDFYNASTGEIGRVASLNHWWRRHGTDDPVGLFLGHGIGASRYGTVPGTEAVKSLFYRIDRSTAAVYLWETGLLGIAAFLGFLLATARLAGRLSRDARLGKEERAVLAAIEPMFLLQPAVIIYDVQLSAFPQMQLLLMLMAGQVLFSARRAAARAATAAGTKKPHDCAAAFPKASFEAGSYRHHPPGLLLAPKGAASKLRSSALP